MDGSPPGNYNEKRQVSSQKICFTANSIHYLATTHLPVNLDEWEWHEELIDGTLTCVITDIKTYERNHATGL